MLPSGRQAPLLVPDHGGVGPPKRVGEKRDLQLVCEPEMPPSGRKLGTGRCSFRARRLWTGPGSASPPPGGCRQAVGAGARRGEHSSIRNARRRSRWRDGMRLHCPLAALEPSAWEAATAPCWQLQVTGIQYPDMFVSSPGPRGSLELLLPLSASQKLRGLSGTCPPRNMTNRGVYGCFPDSPRRFEKPCTQDSVLQMSSSSPEGGDASRAPHLATPVKLGPGHVPCAGPRNVRRPALSRHSPSGW